MERMFVRTLRGLYDPEQERQQRTSLGCWNHQGAADQGHSARGWRGGRGGWGGVGGGIIGRGNNVSASIALQRRATSLMCWCHILYSTWLVQPMSRRGCACAMQSYRPSNHALAALLGGACRSSAQIAETARQSSREAALFHWRGMKAVYAGGRRSSNHVGVGVGG